MVLEAPVVLEVRAQILRIMGITAKAAVTTTALEALAAVEDLAEVLAAEASAEVEVVEGEAEVFAAAAAEAATDKAEADEVVLAAITHSSATVNVATAIREFKDRHFTRFAIPRSMRARSHSTGSR